jgi:hypothetical protein
MSLLIVLMCVYICLCVHAKMQCFEMNTSAHMYLPKEETSKLPPNKPVCCCTESDAVAASDAAARSAWRICFDTHVSACPAWSYLPVQVHKASLAFPYFGPSCHLQTVRTCF